MKTYEKIIYTGGFVFTAWFLLSLVNVVINNVNPNPTYYTWNMFVLFTNIFA